MTTPDLFAPLSFMRGPAMKNRFMLAPLTNKQSHADGRLSDDEFDWLMRRAKGGFGLTMTCAAYVERRGQGFPGQLGVSSDDHLEGLTRLAAAIKAQGSLAVMQLYHGGMRAPAELIGEPPVCPSDNPKAGARAMSLAEVEALVEAFVAAAARAEKAGFDGVELHGAHGYVLCQFLSAEINQRTDRYGGSTENRERVLREVIAGVRSRCRPGFSLGVRLSPERFGVKLADMTAFAQALMREGRLDYIDMSLWDVRKEPEEPEFQGRTLMSYFTELERGDVRLGVAGKVMSAGDARDALAAGADFVLLGRAAILHADFPARAAADPDFISVPLPVSREYLREHGMSPGFLEYMGTFKGFLQAAE